MILVRLNFVGDYLINNLSTLLENTVRFSQAMYIVNENNGVVQVVLNLSNPSSVDTAVKVLSTNETADGKY